MASSGGSSGGGGAAGIPTALLGTYSAGTTYAAGVGVLYAGSTYVSRVGSNVGNQPDTSPTQWQLQARGGDPGADGTNGTNGTNGADGTALPVVSATADGKATKFGTTRSDPAVIGADLLADQTVIGDGAADWRIDIGSGDPPGVGKVYIFVDAAAPYFVFNPTAQAARGMGAALAAAQIGDVIYGRDPVNNRDVQIPIADIQPDGDLLQLIGGPSGLDPWPVVTDGAVMHWYLGRGPATTIDGAQVLVNGMQRSLRRVAPASLWQYFDDRTAGGSPTVLHAGVIPTGRLANDGDRVVAEYLLIMAATGDTASLVIGTGPTTVIDMGSPVITGGMFVKVTATIMRTAADKLRFIAEWQAPLATPPAGVSGSNSEIIGWDWSQAVTLTLMGTSGGGVVTSGMGRAEFIPASTLPA